MLWDFERVLLLLSAYPLRGGRENKNVLIPRSLNLELHSSEHGEGMDGCWVFSGLAFWGTLVCHFCSFCSPVNPVGDYIAWYLLLRIVIYILMGLGRFSLLPFANGNTSLGATPLMIFTNLCPYFVLA